MSPQDVPSTLLDAACDVLSSAAPAAKTAAAEHAAALLKKGAPFGSPAQAEPPDEPARPGRPALAPPGDVPRRRLGSEAGRIALLHAIAHIEFNAIDLAFDMAARFAKDIASLDLDAAAFAADWICVGADEARHFKMVNDRLASLGSAYGALPAHNGLWEAAARTAGQVAARLAVAPLILEARGLDVTPDMIERLRAAKDDESADILGVIYEDEIGHVACGQRWFHKVCIAQQREPAAAFHELRKAYFSGLLKPPFNHAARARAGLPKAFYEPS